jgi:hypothetical protein
MRPVRESKKFRKENEIAVVVSEVATSPYGMDEIAQNGQTANVPYASDADLLYVFFSIMRLIRAPAMMELDTV